MSGLTFDHKPGGNAIVKQATPELLADGTPACGFDNYGQLWTRVNDHPDDPKGWSGRIVADVRAKVCPICSRGWENTVKSISDQEHISSMERWAHKTCMNGFGHLSNFYFWHRIACDVPRDEKLPALKFDEIPNQYGSSWTGPWYAITYACVPQHPFTVGMRKRVYQIKIGGVPKEFGEFLDVAFKAEDVTKGMDSDGNGWYIHAWGREKAERYYNSLYTYANNWQTELAKKAESTAI